MKKSGSGIVFLLFIPIGFVILVYLYDFCQKIYFQNQLNSAVKQVLTETLDRDDLESYEDYREFTLEAFKDKGFTTDDMSLIQKDDYYVLVNYKNYTSVVGELSFGILQTKNLMVHSAYKGYYNEYKETVVEKFKEDIEELYDEGDSSDDEDIVIE